VGYADAGFEVVGVDLNPQPDYPFPILRADAIEVLRELVSRGRYRHVRVDRLAAAHGSPPCQASTALTKGTNKGRTYPQLIPETRRLFDALGVPYVIENVQGSDLRRDLTLCGEMFGLGVLRHRYFELGGWSMSAPTHKPHRGRVRGWRHGTYYDGPYVAVYGEGGGKGSVAEWQEAMGIDWTDNRKAIAEAIPPAYTEHIGRQLLAQLRTAV
jgi:DNA (cytosine-5)-methyltransferase 1